MKYKFTWELGDWSNDGHSASQTFNIRCTHSAKTIRWAYNKLCNRLEWWFHVAICADYQQNEPDETDTAKLAEFGVDWNYEEQLWGEEEFIKLFFLFMKLELPDIEFEIIKNNDEQQLFGYWIGQDDFERRQEGFGNYGFGYGLYGDM